MNFEIAKQIGVTSFLVFHVIKSNPNLTIKEIGELSGVRVRTLRGIVNNLEGAKIVKCDIIPITKTRCVGTYSINYETEWLLH